MEPMAPAQLKFAGKMLRYMDGMSLILPVSAMNLLMAVLAPGSGIKKPTRFCPVPAARQNP
jgi:hypothetical protein